MDKFIYQELNNLSSMAMRVGGDINSIPSLSSFMYTLGNSLQNIANMYGNADTVKWLNGESDVFKAVNLMRRLERKDPLNFTWHAFAAPGYPQDNSEQVKLEFRRKHQSIVAHCHDTGNYKLKAPFTFEGSVVTTEAGECVYKSKAAHGTSEETLIYNIKRSASNSTSYSIVSLIDGDLSYSEDLSSRGKGFCLHKILNRLIDENNIEQIDDLSYDHFHKTIVHASGTWGETEHGDMFNSYFEFGETLEVMDEEVKFTLRFHNADFNLEISCPKAGYLSISSGNCFSAVRESNWGIMDWHRKHKVLALLTRAIADRLAEKQAAKDAEA